MMAGAADPTGRLRATVIRNPGWVDGQRALASLSWELDPKQDCVELFRKALQDDPRNAALWNAYLQTLTGIEDYAGAAAAAAEARRYFDDPVLALIEASNRGMNGENSAVEALIAVVPASRARDEVEVRHRIRIGDLDAAAHIVDRLVAGDATDLGSWAIAEILWRRMSDPRWTWLAGNPKFVAKVGLPYTTDQLALLAQTLEDLHRQQRQPVGQSVRGGTQTRGRLFDRRDAPIVALRDALQSAVEAYRDRLPHYDKDHPLLRHRNRHLRVDGGWSVRLASSGFHVPHLHPDGVLSSAFYVRVPEFDGASKEGWLELGRPALDLRMTLDPLACIEPQPGTLILFPSYLYHSTRPFSAGERMSVAFDVI